MQRIAPGGRQRGVRVLLWWLSCGLAVVLGHEVLGRALPWPLARDLGVAGLVLAAVLGALAVLRASNAPRGGRWAVVSLWVLLLARGSLAAANDDPSQWLGPRGGVDGVRTLLVEEASHPGGRCRARVRSAGIALWLSAPPEACPLAQGQRIRVLGARLHRHETPELPGDPSPLALARSRGAVALATTDRVWSAGGETSLYWGWVAGQRQRAWEVTRGEPAASFVVASALGVRSALPPADRSALRRAGLGHLVAVSGLHVGLAAWALLVLSLRVGARVGGLRGAGVLLSWLPLVGYVLLTGASPPAVRAGLMAMGVGLGSILGRPHHGPVLLAATSVMMLVVRPAWATDPGFQLSVVAMAVLVRAPAGEGLVRQTWRVTWAVLPLSLWHFGHAGGWGVVSNLVAVPVFTLWILPLGLLGWWLVPWLGALALAPAGSGAQLVLDVARATGELPSAPVWVVAMLAGIGLGLGAWVGRRGSEGRLRPLGAWLPPAPVALGVILVVLWPQDRLVPVGARWWAAGSPRAPAVVTVAASVEHGCIHQAALSDERWRRLLDAAELRRVGFAPGIGALEPHEHALRRTLRRARRWVDAPNGCGTPPPATSLRRVMEECRRWAGTHHVMLVGTSSGAWCFVAGQWRRSSPGLLDSAAPEVAP